MSDPTIPDVNQGSASSSVQTSDVNTAAASSPAASSPDVTPAASSPADGVKPKDAPTLKDRIAEGIAKITGKTSATTAPVEAKTETDQTKTAPEGAENPDPETDKEEKGLGELKDHPAVKAILNERKQARAKLTLAMKEMETYKGDATQYRKIQGYLDSNGVKPADAANALKLTALAHTNPQEFYKKITEMAAEWGQNLGETLPADLQQEVADGLITPERAAELSRARGQTKIAQAQVENANERITVSDGAREMQYRTQLFESWAGQVSKTDPDLNKKLPLMTARLTQILTAEGDPGTPQAAWERLNRAHKEVSDHIRAFQPAKPALQPSPASTGTVRGPVSAPSNFQEAMTAGIHKLVSGGR